MVQLISGVTNSTEAQFASDAGFEDVVFRLAIPVEIAALQQGIPPG
jgi:hypothetical protein